MASVYKIFPPIGIARIGNSESVYFIGPESPGKQPSGPFRDRSTNKKIKPQAVRFRIYKFERDEFGKEVCQEEITVKKGIAIEWSIHLINRKAAGGRFPPGGPTPDLRNYGYDRQGLTINSQMHSITGKSKPEEKLTGEISFIKNGVVEGTANVNLGRIITDQKGRLLVIGGTGESKSPLNKGLTGFANNDGWYDGVSDGPVRARILIGENEPIEAEGGAWALIAPPSYAPEIENVVTWYDQAMNVNSRSFSPELKTMVPSFTKDIYPILKRTTLLSWVVEQSQRHHGSSGNFLESTRLRALISNSDESREARQHVFEWLVKPNTPAPAVEQFPLSKPNMPKLFSGLDPDDPSRAEYAALTNHQYSLMQKWAEGNFIADWNGEPQVTDLDDLPLEDQPAALTRAALEACIGAPFFPGIEGTYVIAQAETYIEPFRIDHRHPAGFLTERMALPWQADFIACGQLWWPAQRPVEVTTRSGTRESFSRGINDYADMVRWWTELGFVVQRRGKFVESERNEINGQS